MKFYFQFRNFLSTVVIVAVSTLQLLQLFKLLLTTHFLKLKFVFPKVLCPVATQLIFLLGLCEKYEDTDISGYFKPLVVLDL